MMSRSVNIGALAVYFSCTLIFLPTHATLLSNTTNQYSIHPETVSDDNPISSLKDWLRVEFENRPALQDQPFASDHLSRQQAEEAQDLLWQDFVDRIKSERKSEFEQRIVSTGDITMKYAYSVHGDPGPNGRSLFISMHGGGGTAARVNDQQWRNQQRLYRPEEGIYLAPRAPTNTWNLWHQAHIDKLFDQMITDMIVFENVDPNRVYLMGYSAGGDGVYQVAPRMADRFAAAAMMAGHPNESSPLGLRNLPFAIYCGGRDSAYDRNQKAEEWAAQLKKLASADQDGYVFRVKIYPDKGHWMDRKDAESIPWMSEFERNSRPVKIVWQQDDVFNNRFYWLAMEQDANIDRSRVVVSRDQNEFRIVENSHQRNLKLLLNDSLADLDQPVKITQGDDVLFNGTVARTILAISESINERGDPASVFSARIEIPGKPKP